MINILNFIANTTAQISAPKGMWESIIHGIRSFAGSYGVTILLLTLFIKLAMTPLDFWQKLNQKMTTLSQVKMKPELDAINKRYAYDKNMQQQKTMEVYRKHGVSPMGSCLALLVNMAVMLAVFITLINGMNRMSRYTMQTQYMTLESIYEQAYAADENPEEAVLAAWKDGKGVRESFLWIKNIWRADSNQSLILPYNQMDTKGWVSNKKNYFVEQRAAQGELLGISTDEVYTGPKLKLDDNDNLVITSEFYSQVSEESYQQVMGILIEDTQGEWNGYYILTILAVLTTYVSTKLINATTKKKGEKDAPKVADPTAQMGKTTTVIMPVLMGFFTLWSTSTFAIYLVISQVLSVATSMALNPIINKIISKKEKKHDDAKPTINYSR